MDFDASTLVYIVAVAVYFLYSTFFRKKEPPQTGTEQPEVKPQKTASFDELLKEIRREQGQLDRDMKGEVVEEDYYGEEEVYEEKRKPVLQPAPKKYFTYEDPKQFPTADAAGQKKTNKFEKYEKQPLVRLNDQVDLHSDEKILGEVEDVAGQFQKSNKYANLLKNPKTIREAIVVSEILNRKHF